MTATEVDVWKIPLNMEEEVARYRRLLSEDELQRADRLCFEKQRARFIAARAAMRQILSGYLNAPHQLTFAYGAQGNVQPGASLTF
jgi:4'-phosphopantetheinyl transferase